MGTEQPGVQPGTCTTFNQNGSLIVYKDGVVGNLSDEQIQRLCRGTEHNKNPIYSNTKKKMEQIGKIQKACLPKVVQPEDYMKCVLEQAAESLGCSAKTTCTGAKCSKIQISCNGRIDIVEQ